MIKNIGLIAACLTTISFLPQVLQVLKTKNTKSISLNMYIIFVIGVLMWLTYGILIKDLPIILANLFTGVLSSTILYYKIVEVRKRKNKRNVLKKTRKNLK